MQAFLRIHPDDKVAVALETQNEHSEISMDGEEIVLLEDIPQGNKFALCDMGEGEEVIKYGAPVGIAKSEIRRGSWVHTHNMKTGLGGLLTYTYEPQTGGMQAQEARTSAENSRKSQAGHGIPKTRRKSGSPQ